MAVHTTDIPQMIEIITLRLKYNYDDKYDD